MSALRGIIPSLAVGLQHGARPPITRLFALFPALHNSREGWNIEMSHLAALKACQPWKMWRSNRVRWGHNWGQWNSCGPNWSQWHESVCFPQKNVVWMKGRHCTYISCGICSFGRKQQRYFITIQWPCCPKSLICPWASWVTLFEWHILAAVISL